MSRASGTTQETELGRRAVDEEVSYQERHLGTGDPEGSTKGRDKKQRKV